MEQMSDIKLVKQLTKTRDQFNTEISKRVFSIKPGKDVRIIFPANLEVSKKS